MSRREHDIDWEKARRESPRLAAIVARGAELLQIAQDLGAFEIALCGSVARSEDGDQSDIDFFVHDFADPGAADARDRADRLVGSFRRTLRPYDVDIRGMPGWLIDPEFEATMRLDAVDLHHLLAAFEA